MVCLRNLCKALTKHICASQLYGLSSIVANIYILKSFFTRSKKYGASQWENHKC